MDVLEVFETMDYGPAPEAPDTAYAWLDEHDRHFGLFINNEWVKPPDAGTYTSFNPATGEVLAETTQAMQPEVDAAVAAARQAFKSWRQTPGVARGRATSMRLLAISRNTLV